MGRRILWKAVLWLVAILTDRVRHVSALPAGLVLAAALLLLGLFALGLQKRIVRSLRAAPDGTVSTIAGELTYSVLGFVAGPVIFVVTSFWEAAQRLKSKARGEQDAKEKAAPGVLAASIGPTFVLSGFGVAAMLVVARMVSPLLAAQLGLPKGACPWEFLTLGQVAAFGWYLPVDRHPYVGALLVSLTSLWIWWTAARVLRLWWRKTLGRNLWEVRDDAAVLAPWRRYLGATDLWQAHASFRSWAKWLSILPIPLLIWSWVALGAVPYRVPPSMFSAALCLWAGWSLNLVLSGCSDQTKEKGTDQSAVTALSPGWKEVLEELARARGADAPVAVAKPRRIASLFEDGAHDPPGLLVELVSSGSDASSPKKLNRMQHTMLDLVARQGYVQLSPPAVGDALVLRAKEDSDERALRGHLVIAPESCGKTTLAILASCQHVLVHSTSVLLVAGSVASADALYSQAKSAVDGSTLRWNIRVRRCSQDLGDDMANRILPDVVVASLEDLTLKVLGRGSRFDAVVRSVGLIVIDDLEALVGPLEVHAQLTFRRLYARVAELCGSRDIEGPVAPVVLALAAPSMADMGTWSHSVLGRDLSVSEWVPACRAETEIVMTEAECEIPAQIVYRLVDLHSGNGRSLAAEDVVAACEAVSVPWHFRAAGDERRGIGRDLIPLTLEPKFYREDPSDAAVLLVQGSWTAVEVEIGRLVRAGHRYVGDGTEVRGAHGVVAILRLVDPDEDVVLTHLDAQAPLGVSIRQLPRAAVRAPAGSTIESHMAAELTERWMEVADVVRVFGPGSATMLSRLASARLLAIREENDIASSGDAFERRVPVRVLERAIGEHPLTIQERDDGSRARLPPRVSCVTDAAAQRVNVRDVASSRLVGVVDAASAPYLYYPGRVIEAKGGRFVVAGRAVAEGQAPFALSEYLVEPFADVNVTAARRRTKVRVLDVSVPGAIEGGAATAPISEPRHAVLLGEEPFDVCAAPIECTTQHMATLRMQPGSATVVQRAYFPPEAAERRASLLRTFGVVLHPVPAKGTPRTRLDLCAARLVAAAMRMALRQTYRDAAGAMDLALQVGELEPGPDYLLTADDAFVVFELAEFGNGCTRAVSRDGLDLLLRLARLALERILRLDAFLARYDEWADDREFVDAEWLLTQPVARAQRFAEARTAALVWLDAHLGREGALASASEDAPLMGKGESGEGDACDLGRVWVAGETSARDLLWTRHRWRGPMGEEALLDFGMCRKEFAEVSGRSSVAGKKGRILEEYLAQHGGAGALGLAVPVTIADGEPQGAPGSGEQGLPPSILESHKAAVAAILDAWDLVDGLAECLAAGLSGGADEGAEVGAAQAIDRCVGMVQAFGSLETEGVTLHVADALVRRLASPTTRVGLATALLRRAGVEGGMFVSEDGKVCGALGISSEEVQGVSGGGAVAMARAWAASNELFRKPPFAVVQPGASGGELLFVPVNLECPAPLGAARVEEAQRWYFLPLGVAWAISEPQDGDVVEDESASVGL